jgi:hypothetical protein
VLDEGAQLGQDLAFARVIQEYPRRHRGKARQQRLQPAVRDRRLGERPGKLSQSNAFNRRPEKRWVVMRDKRSRYDRLERLVAD